MLFACLLFFETGSCCVDLAGQELDMQTRQASSSKKSACLCQLSVWIKGMYYYARPTYMLLGTPVTSTVL